MTTLPPVLTTVSDVATTPAYPDRDLRQREIIPPAKLAACRAVVIGVGAVGRQVALQLAAVGIGDMTLVDFDTVNIENLAPQAYWPCDLGRPKIQATADICRSIHPELRLKLHPERFRRSSAAALTAPGAVATDVALFACVDSIETRKLIWNATRPRLGFWADGRMSAEIVRVLASGEPASDPHYGTTLFPEAQAHVGSCTAKSTVYAASIAAGLMLAQFTRWLRGLPVDRDVLLNLLSMELAVA